VIGEVNRAISATGDFADDALIRHDLVGGTAQTHEFDMQPEIRYFPAMVAPGPIE
jgi:hypothetical protein